jgi:hypothetical protein
MYSIMPERFILNLPSIDSSTIGVTIPNLDSWQKLHQDYPWSLTDPTTLAANKFSWWYSFRMTYKSF